MIVTSRAGSRTVKFDVHNKGERIEFFINEGHTRLDPIQIGIDDADNLIRAIRLAQENAEYAKFARNRREQ